MTPLTLTLYQRIYPGWHPPTYWRILRVLRRMAHVGRTPPQDERGNRRPAHFGGMVGRCLQMMARRRRVRR